MLAKSNSTAYEKKKKKEKIRSRKLPFEIKIQRGCSRDSKNKINIFIRARNKRRKG